MNGPEFASESASVNGTTLHYERGGEGPTVLLIHGFPQDWYEWRHVMPRLARRFSVVAMDLRGVGGSAAPATGYYAACMATDVAELVEGLAVDLRARPAANPDRVSRQQPGAARR